MYSCHVTGIYHSRKPEANSSHLTHESFKSHTSIGMGSKLCSRSKCLNIQLISLHRAKSCVSLLHRALNGKNNWIFLVFYKLQLIRVSNLQITRTFVLYLICTTCGFRCQLYSLIVQMVRIVLLLWSFKNSFDMSL